MISMERFNVFKEELSKDTIIEIKYKDESLFMKTLGKLMFFNKTFMNDFITTIGNVVYYPSKDFVEKNTIACTLALAHEFIHIKDSQRMGIFYNLSYLFPQILSVLSLGALLSFIIPWTIWFLLFLVFLLPLPSIGRKQIEERGYKMTLFVVKLYCEERGFSDKEILDVLFENCNISEQFFVGPCYYYMWPFGIQKELKDFSNKIMQEDIDDSIFKIVKKSFKNSKV